MFRILLLLMFTASASSDQIISGGVAGMTCDIIKETGHSEQFMWDLPILKNDPVVVGFSVYAKSEVYLALSNKLGPDLQDAIVYYIVIGGYGNTVSYISLCRDCEPLTGVSSEALQCDRLNHYWIHFEDGFIKLGLRGKVEPILQYKVPQSDFDPRYLGYSSNLLSQGMFTFSFDKFGYHIYSEHVYWTGEAFCLDWFLNEIPTGLKDFCFQAQVAQGPIYVVFSPQRFRNPGEIAYEIVIGANDNSMTLVYSKLRGDHPIKEVSTSSILNPNSFVEYCFTFKELEITFGTAGNRDLVVWKRDLSIQIKHIGFAGSKTPAKFLFPVEFIPLYYQGVINLPAEHPAGEDKCLEKPCGDYGNCAVDHSFTHGFRCTCTNGYTGKHCDIPPPEVEPEEQLTDVKTTTPPKKRTTTPPPDTQPPTINCNVELEDHYVASADSRRMQVAFSLPRAQDNSDKNPHVVCDQASNSEFLIGTSKVKCTATDSAGNKASCDLIVEVKNSCQNNPCGIHGTCVVEAFEPSKFTCICNSDYEGDRCENAPQIDEEEEFSFEDVKTTEPPKQKTTTPPPDPCEGNPCGKHGVCKRSPDGYKCLCTDDYMGKLCDVLEPEEQLTDVKTTTPPKKRTTTPPPDPCEGNPCGEHGVCKRRRDGYKCVCTDGYTGRKCNEPEQQETDVKTTTPPKKRTTTPPPDKVAPKVTCPGDMLEQTDRGSNSKQLTWEVSASDDVDGDVHVECYPKSRSSFEIGRKEVECHAVDEAGNRGQCTFEVIIEDGEEPTIECPENKEMYITRDGSETKRVSYKKPKTTDNCGTKPKVSCEPKSHFAFPIGETTVECTATDTQGNNRQCSFVVTIKDPCEGNPCGEHGICKRKKNGYKCKCKKGYKGRKCDEKTPEEQPKDTEDPTIECPTNMKDIQVPVDNSQAPVSFEDPQVHDNVDPTPSVVCNPSSGSLFSVGDTEVECTVTDASGNDNSCTFQVTVDDNTAPELDCPDAMTFSAEKGSNSHTVEFTVNAKDNVDGESAVTCTPPSGTSFIVGPHTVICRSTDAAQNDNQCSFGITVKDNEAPVISGCPTDDIRDVPLYETYKYAVPTANDNADGKVLVTCTPTPDSDFSVGETAVKCTAIDNAQNPATCSFNVHVLDPCLDNLCVNGAVCKVDFEVPLTYRCLCRGEYYGIYCQYQALDTEVKTTTPSKKRTTTPPIDEEKEEVFETTGDNEEVIRKEFDEKEISVFEISPFNDEVSKEFKIECEIGTFSLDVNAQTFSLKNDNGKRLESQTTPETSGSLKFSIEITKSAFIIYNMLDQNSDSSPTALIEYSPPERKADKDLNCKAFTVRNVGKKRQRGCRITYSKITQQKWKNYRKQLFKSDTYVRKTSGDKKRKRFVRKDQPKTRKIEKGDTYVGKTSGEKKRQRIVRKDQSKTRKIEKGDTYVGKTTNTKTRQKQPEQDEKTSDAFTSGGVEVVDWQERKCEVNFNDKLEDILTLEYQDGKVLIIDVTSIRMAITDQSGKELASKSLEDKVKGNRLGFTIYLITGGLKIQLENEQRPFLVYYRKGRSSTCTRLKEQYRSTTSTGSGKVKSYSGYRSKQGYRRYTY